MPHLGQLHNPTRKQSCIVVILLQSLAHLQQRNSACHSTRSISPQCTSSMAQPHAKARMLQFPGKHGHDASATGTGTGSQADFY